MTPTSRKPTVITLTRKQVASILYDMGWDDEDTAVFWRSARRETRDPGCHERARQAYWARVMASEDR